MEPQRVKSLRLTSEEVLLAAGGKMASVAVQTPSDALKVSLLMMMKHTADVHLTVLEIIAEKYKLNIDEVLDTVKAHPRWHEILQTPLVSDLTATAIAHTAPPAPQAKEPAKPRGKKTTAPKAPAKATAIKIADTEEEVYE
jgi:hypothetical protein